MFYKIKIAIENKLLTTVEILILQAKNVNGTVCPTMSEKFRTSGNFGRWAMADVKLNPCFVLFLMAAWPASPKPLQHYDYIIGYKFCLGKGISNS